MGSNSSKHISEALQNISQNSCSAIVKDPASCPCHEVVHRHISCQKWPIVCAKSSFLSALRIYGPLFITTWLIQSKFKPNLNELFLRTIPAIVRSSSFLAVISGMFPLLVCLWSKAGFKHSRGSLWFSSFFAALSGILIEKSHRRTELAVYVANQAVELYYRMLRSRGWIPEIEHGSEILFTLSFAVLNYFHRNQRDCLASSVNGLLKVIVGVEDKPDKIESLTSNLYFKIKEKSPPFLSFLFSEDETSEKSRQCCHRSGCKSYGVIGFLKAFLLGFFVRTLFNLLPALLLGGPKKFLEALPNIFNTKSLKFAMFWGVMGGGPRVTECLLKWLRGGDVPNTPLEDGINSVLAGLVGGLAVVFFSSNELAMYIASKAVESLFYFACSKNIVRPRKNAEVLLFAISTASLFYASAYEPHNLRSSYFTWLMKTSNGHWAHFYKSFSDVRLASGVPDIQSFNQWEQNFGEKVIKKFIPSQQLKTLYNTN
eukprot:TRINITY_DN3532_c0_g2_i1.p1 TRINITY_DN3532_c0_g2~~TRINITY_DN3532_c0_g2_i1.p1  ORF type:complete len:485 (+),score=67.74 TRINITY_DN3532_c0_g2_i1:9-1463(+)